MALGLHHDRIIAARIHHADFLVFGVCCECRSVLFPAQALNDVGMLVIAEDFLLRCQVVEDYSARRCGMQQAVSRRMEADSFDALLAVRESALSVEERLF